MDLAFDQTSGDIYLNEGGDIALVTDQADAITQLVNQTLLFVQGEYFLDLSQGVPYFQQILGQKILNQLAMDSALKLAVAGVEGVAELLSFSTDLDTTTRALEVGGTFRIFGDDTPVDFNVSIGL